ncbi:gamma-type small acid-soluble spore protein [Bacillus hwajinpoensis]|uniref:Small, acid-soluble spore protein gamma-type n=1 Tax=Guptibacillus hwajinpoensis TaxID=208199 RepID=A0A845F3H0_9BACL|nr:gamma-type small acid-soluble spore protein [Pseudalkalibacillus hwajinpoensis]MCA0992606.1 gamma-type small acid-soluble spore protein [Pseudalkalibacillus hwajinpoensis]MYL65349.1 gamma-type small acid-soluble spore protein [Pseudalkalibacillus hwajinpoensis]
MAKKPGQTQAGTSIQHVKQQNQQASAGQAGQQQYGAEFASETDAQEVKARNAKSAQNKQQASAGQAGQQQYGAEFASETDAQQVKARNAKSAQNKQQASAKNNQQQQ